MSLYRYSNLLIVFIFLVSGCIEKNDPVEEFYKNGSLKSRYILIEKKLQGNYFEFHDNGNMKSSIHYENGLMDGEAKEYYKNGKLRFTGQNQGGKRVGSWTYFDEAGKVIAIGKYEDGFKVGFWNYFQETSKKNYRINWYVRSFQNFKINLPSNWKVIENPIDGIIVSVIDSSNDRNNFNIYRDEIGSEYALHDLVYSNFNTNEIIVVRKMGSTTINSLEAIWVVAGIKSEPPQDLIQFNIKRDTEVYTSSFFCNPNDFDLMNQLYREIALSLTF
ncbi:MAG: hypothetical protein R8G66_16395 [Cytophagales bacterium]|nr:hypothetical protein [Cytophagales bacterium]